MDPTRARSAMQEKKILVGPSWKISEELHMSISAT